MKKNNTLTKTKIEYFKLLDSYNSIEDLYYSLCKLVDDVPTADVQEVKHGTWENTNTPNQLRCSNCEIIHFIAQYPHGEINYCPNCGTRMDGDSL